MNSLGSRLAMPYPGLRPFDSEDEPIFFGREGEVSAMLRQLEDRRFVAVVGSSGSGKSSLVRAGLLPAIREGFLLGSTGWLPLVIRPGREPYRHLASSLARAHASMDGDAEDRFLTRLRKSDRGLFEALGESGLPQEIRVIVVIDQFEELFAFRRATAVRGDVAARDKAADFVSMLLRTASDSEARVWVVLTMRSEFIGDCETFLGLPEAISRSQFLVPRLDRRQMEEAIRRPGEVREAAFRPFTFEEGLVNCMINEAGDRPDQLPLLQHALMRTWKSAVERAGKEGSAVLLTNDDYRKSGGIDEALSLHADAAWKTIAKDPHKARIARQLFLLLCDISPDGQIIRRRPKVAEVEAVTEAGVGEIEEVVRLFQDDDRNFLLPPREEKLSSEAYLDISHEALLRQWRLIANDWLVEERSDVEEVRRLVQQASLRRKGKGDVLGPQDLERIRDWRERVSRKWALRYVTEKTWDEVLAFVQESETEAERKRSAEARQARVRKRLLLLLGFVLVLTTIISLSFARRAQTKADDAERAKKNAEEALTQSCVRIIGVSDRYSLSADERAALWELSELDIANQSVRKKVIDIWMQAADPDYMVRAHAYDSRGLHAAIGLNAMLRAACDSRTNEAADRLAKALENPQETNSFRLYRLGDALAALAACMNPNDAASVADGLAKALENTQERDSFRLSSLGYALGALAARMNLNDAASVAARGAAVLAKALENPRETLDNKHTDSYRLSRLGDALGALAAHMNPNDAASVANGLVRVLENAQEEDSSHLSSLGYALGALAARMNLNDSASVAARGAAVLAKALENPKLKDQSDFEFSDHSDAREPLVARMKRSNALAALSMRMNPDAVASVAEGIAKALENAQETNSQRLISLCEALAALSARMNPNDAASVANGIAKALENAQEADSFRLWSLGYALAALSARMNINDAASVAARGASVLAKALESPQETDSFRLSSLGYALGALSAHMNPNDAASVAARGASVLAKALESPREMDSYRLSPLGEALAALSARMNINDAASVAARGASVLAKALENPRETDSYRLLGDALAALSARMNINDAANVAGGIAKALENAQQANSKRLASLGVALAALSAKIPSARQTQLVALSNLFLGNVSGPPNNGKGREDEAQNRTKIVTPLVTMLVARICALLNAVELAEMLKWPFCVGEAQKLVFAELEKKIKEKNGRTFDGDVWKFVQQVDSLGINGLDRKFLDQPAKRPKAEDVLKELELEAIRANVEKDPPSPTHPLSPSR